MRKNKAPRCWVVLATFVALSLGCAGSRQRVEFATVNVPVSLSQSLLDQDGTIVRPGTLETVGRFEGEFTGWSIFWTLVRLNRIDVSEALNARVEELDGDGVIRLRCRLEPGGVGLWNYPVWINMLPVWPGAVKVTVDADVVRVRREAV